MGFVSQDLVFALAIVLQVLGTLYLGAFGNSENNIKSAVFLSPKIEIGPGSVANKYFHDIEFPKGHVALKNVNAEVIDEAGNPVPLHEAYLHHWAIWVFKTHTEFDSNQVLHQLNYVVRNSGICQQDILRHYFGLGSETRGTSMHIPDPFGIEIGNPNGYEDKWLLNVHVIDTRGVEDRMGCTECRCNLYNVTKDEHGKPLRPDYIGGLNCCYDYTQCRLRNGFEDTKRSIYLRYTVEWVDWNSFIVPIKIYILDVTDTLSISDDSKGMIPNHDCQVEYEVEPCSNDHKDENGCLHVKRASIPMQTGGYVIYGVAHQHAGANGATLYGQDGRVICSSIPNYGNGKEAGNEEEYIVGMSTCYPQPGSVKIIDGETLTVVSNYSSNQGHTGVMGLFYLLVAEQLPDQYV